MSRRQQPLPGWLLEKVIVTDRMQRVRCKDCGAGITAGWTTLPGLHVTADLALLDPAAELACWAVLGKRTIGAEQSGGTFRFTRYRQIPGLQYQTRIHDQYILAEHKCGTGAPSTTPLDMNKPKARPLPTQIPF